MELRFKIQHPFKAIAILFAIFFACLILGVVYFRTNKTDLLLPDSVTAQIKDFDVYFYSGSIPAGYSLNKSLVKFEGGVLMARLDKQGGPSVTLTEQMLPAKLTDQEIQQNGTTIHDTAGPATINDVEGRLVGTLISPNRKTLVLLNSPGDTSKTDLTLLLQGLRTK